MLEVRTLRDYTEIGAVLAPLYIQTAMDLEHIQLDQFIATNQLLRYIRAADIYATAGAMLPNGREPRAWGKRHKKILRREGWNSNAIKGLLLCYREALATIDYNVYLGSAEWEDCRALTHARFGEACAICGDRSRLQVHHRTYERRGWERHDDLTLLCGACHTNHHGQP